jgi:hypothetical protein
MIQSFFKKNGVHFAALGIFLLVSIFYCKPALEGKVLNQHDTQGWKGMAQQSFEYKEKYGHFPYWMNSSFSGMPSFQIAFETPNKISVGYVHYLFTLGLPKPVSFFFLACIMAYFLFCVLKINPWIGIMGGIAYAFATYNPIIVAVGHETKMLCIAYMPAVVASVILLFNKKYLIGFLLTTLSVSMIIMQNHLQVTYYTFILLLCMGIAFLIEQVRKNEISTALKAGGLSLVAALMAVGINLASIWPTNEFAKETMRGGRSELTDTSNLKNKTQGGLDKDYAFMYGSYGIAETFTAMVPSIYGGGSAGQPLKEDGAFAQKLTEVGVPEETAIQYANGYAYWGNQPGHAGPVYFGAVICFLVVASLVFTKGWLKWALLAASGFAIVLAWGKNVEGINYFLYDHLPFYKKFRAPAIALVIPQLAFVTIACTALQAMLWENLNKEEAFKKFKLSVVITTGILAVLALLYFSFDYKGPNDAGLKENFTNGMLQQSAKGETPTPEMKQQAETFGRTVLKSLEKDRQGLFGVDLLRAMALIAATVVLIGLYFKNKLKAGYAMAAVAVLCCIDILSVANRYLNADKFAESTEVESIFTPSAAVQQILADKTGFFRVFDQTAPEGSFQDSKLSYYLNSIGGYSPAKLALYQDIIEHQLSKGNMNVFNMLNTKYFIVQNPTNGQPIAQQNPGALGNCWFVKGFDIVANADAEMKRLDQLNTKDSAVVDTRFKAIVGNPPTYDSNASIVMKENRNDTIVYESTASTAQFAVFSEVYYPHGWQAYIDNKPTPYARVNYVLRGLPVPAGKHTIEFRFESATIMLSDTISKWVNILMYLLIIGSIVWSIKKKNNVTRHEST